MSRLSNFIEKTFKGYNKVYSDKSNSVYYHVGLKCIRISDHTVVGASNADIGIIIPNNVKTIYVVQFKNNARTLVFTYPELKALLTSLKLMWEVGYAPSKVDEDLVNKKYKQNLRLLQEEKQKIISLNKEMTKLKFKLDEKILDNNLLKQEFNFLTDKQKARINTLLDTYRKQSKK